MSQKQIPDFSGFFAADMPLISVPFTVQGQSCELFGRALDNADYDEFIRRLGANEEPKSTYFWAMARVFVKGHVQTLDPQTQKWSPVSLPLTIEERESFFNPTDREKRLPVEVLAWLCEQVNQINGLGAPAQGESNASST